jgi:hypothetical protein
MKQLIGEDTDWMDAFEDAHQRRKAEEAARRELKYQQELRKEAIKRELAFIHWMDSYSDEEKWRHVFNLLNGYEND